MKSEQAQSGFGQVVIRRDASDDIKMRDLFVTLDDGQEMRLLYGESLELQVPVGRHTILATNKVYRKLDEFELAEGQNVVYQAVNVLTKGLFSTVLMMTGTVLYKVRLERVTGPSKP